MRGAEAYSIGAQRATRSAYAPSALEGLRRHATVPANHYSGVVCGLKGRILRRAKML
jgi:hypothetical protein